jgi:sugar phosphate isomerase/epimerase
VSKLGTTTLPLAGWIANRQQAGESRTQRLQAIRQIVTNHGLDAVELTLDLHAIYPQVFDSRFYQSVAELQQTLGFLCTVHLPFLWIELASLNEQIREASIASLRQAIEVTRPVDVHTYVLHLWGFTTMQVLSQLQDSVQRELVTGVLMSQASRSLAALCEVIDPADLCVENLEDSLFELAVPIVEEHGTSICLDVGHLALQGGSSLGFLDQHRDRIREVHLHDAIVPGTGEWQTARDHLALGRGDLDHEAFLDKLAEIGYEGPIILELNSEPDLVQSLQRLKSVM